MKSSGEVVLMARARLPLRSKTVLFLGCNIVCPTLVRLFHAFKYNCQPSNLPLRLACVTVVQHVHVGGGRFNRGVVSEIEKMLNYPQRFAVPLKVFGRSSAVIVLQIKIKITMSIEVLTNNSPQNACEMGRRSDGTSLRQNWGLRTFSISSVDFPSASTPYYGQTKLNTQHHARTLSLTLPLTRLPHITRAT